MFPPGAADDLSESQTCGLVVRCLHLLECQLDDWVLPHLGGVAFTRLKNLRAFEEPLPAPVDVEEAVQHREIHGFAEAARAGVERDLATVAQHVLDQQGLVNIVVVALDQPVVVVDALRDVFFLRFHLALLKLAYSII